MKTTLTFLSLIMFTFFSWSQDKNPQFGVTLGYGLLSINSNEEGSESQSGFFVGGLLDFELTEQWHIEPKILYANYSDAGFLHAPIFAKYYVTNSFNVQAGPQLTVVLDDPFNTIKEIGVDLGIGIAYDFSTNAFIEARYAFELTNRVTDEFREFEELEDFRLGINSFMVGFGYKF